MVKWATGVGVLLLVLVVGPVEADEYQILAERSRVLVLVYRAGLLSGLGHNHVVGVKDFSGTISLDQAVPRFRLFIPLRALVVDRPELRAKAGPDFSALLDPETIRATYENMVGPRVLDIDTHPLARINGHAEQVAGDERAWRVQASVTLHGVTRQLAPRVFVMQTGDTLVARGQLTLSQRAFGMEPLSLLMGALKVRDEVEVRFRLFARRLTTD